MNRNLLADGIAPLIILLLVFFFGCGGGGSAGSGGNNSATIKGTVAGTTIIAFNNNNAEIDRSTASGSPKSFSLTVPVGGTYKLILLENEWSANQKIFPLYEGSANLFTINSPATINLGYVDTSSGIAVPANNPLVITGVSAGGENTTIPAISQFPPGSVVPPTQRVGPLRVVATGPYEVWGGNDRSSHFTYYYNIDSQPSYTKLGEATSTATFDTGSNKFIVIVSRSLAQIDAVQMPNGEYLKYCSPSYLCNLYDYGNTYSNINIDINSMTDIHNIIGPPDGVVGYMGFPAGSGLSNGGTCQSYLVLQDFTVMSITPEPTIPDACSSCYWGWGTYPNGNTGYMWKCTGEYVPSETCNK